MIYLRFHRETQILKFQPWECVWVSHCQHSNSTIRKAVRALAPVPVTRSFSNVAHRLLFCIWGSLFIQTITRIIQTPKAEVGFWNLQIGSTHFHQTYCFQNYLKLCSWFMRSDKYWCGWQHSLYTKTNKWKHASLLHVYRCISCRTKSNVSRKCDFYSTWFSTWHACTVRTRMSDLHDWCLRALCTTHTMCKISQSAVCPCYPVFAMITCILYRVPVTCTRASYTVCTWHTRAVVLPWHTLVRMHACAIHPGQHFQDMHSSSLRPCHNVHHIPASPQAPYHIAPDMRVLRRLMPHRPWHELARLTPVSSWAVYASVCSMPCESEMSARVPCPFHTLRDIRPTAPCSWHPLRTKKWTRPT